MLNGSSPLTRGKRVAPPAPPVGPGLIPAHAGKTVLDNAEYFTAWAHPRSRGENLHRPESPAPRPRLIPAHAGKTLVYWAAHQMGRAHPRSRGENAMAKGEITAQEGSSPLTRGKPGTRQSTEGMTGLIPAHAGKTPRG